MAYNIFTFSENNFIILQKFYNYKRNFKRTKKNNKMSCYNNNKFPYIMLRLYMYTF